MNVIAMRTAAFIVGSMIAGCVYTAKNAPNEAGAASIAPVVVYPSAHKTSGNRDGDSADVSLALPAGSLRFRAVRYETSAAPTAVVAFYQHELGKLGKVSQERGGPHTKFSGFRWVAGPGQTTLQAGRTIVGVKPLGSATEFALIQIDAVGAANRNAR